MDFRDRLLREDIMSVWFFRCIWLFDERKGWCFDDCDFDEYWYFLINLRDRLFREDIMSVRFDKWRFDGKDDLKLLCKINEVKLIL